MHSTNGTPSRITFGPFPVTSQVFLTTPHSFALVNLKPLLPGHVLVCPLKPHRRLTDLSPTELVDLFSAVQRVQRMLARYYFPAPSSSPGHSSPSQSSTAQRVSLVQPPAEYNGSFNIALQDGPEAGQTVPHVHVHIIPRIRGLNEKEGETPSDELYERMAEEDGNVGGWQWDLMQRQQQQQGRPKPGGKFPRIEDAEREARGMEEMEREAGVYRTLLREMEEEERQAERVRREVESVVPF
ncbi:hypothetical protein OQA88_12880 [Cercophora sp. LCS_1]